MNSSAFSWAVDSVVTQPVGNGFDGCELSSAAVLVPAETCKSLNTT